MNKLTKIGVSALAGSLAAVAANAGEVAVSGSAVLTYISEDIKNQHTGGGFGMKNNIGFTGSGDVNGYEVTYFHLMDDNGGSATSNSLTVDMGDMGSIKFDQGTGGNGLDAFDDTLPTAYEETSDGMTGQLAYAGDESTNTFAYKNTIAGFSVNIAYDNATGDTDIADGGHGTTGTTGSSQSIAVGLPSLVDGLSAGVAMGEDSIADGTTSSTDVESLIGFANYSVGPVTAGIMMAETSGGSDGAVMKQMNGIGVSFNVNENLSVSYANMEQDYKNSGATADVTEESTGIALAYTMGSATLAIQQNEQDNPGGSTTAQDEERTELALTLAF